MGTQPFGNLMFNTGVMAGGDDLESFEPLVEGDFIPGSKVVVETMSSAFANLVAELARADGETHDILVTFRYAVDGVDYVRQAVSGNRSSNVERAPRRLAAYRPGSRHQISYRRDDPNVIQFDIWNRDPDVLPFGMLLAAVAVVVLGVVMWRKPDE